VQVHVFATSVLDLQIKEHGFAYDVTVCFGVKTPLQLLRLGTDTQSLEISTAINANTAAADSFTPHNCGLEGKWTELTDVL
jgi:hypothetical protein